MSLAPGTTVNKDPDASKVYTMEWAAWLVGAATIASSAWAITAPAGDATPLTVDNPTNTTTTASVRLLGGTLGKTYTVRNRIVTSESPTQTDDKSFRVHVVQE